MFQNGGQKLVISLKSSSVELSVIDLSKNPVLLLNTKETLLYKEALTPQTFVDKTTEALDKILKSNYSEIIKKLKGSNECEIILHAPWFLPELIYQKNEGGQINLKDFFKQSVKPPEQKEYVQIENKITNILLNGYNLTKLKDVKAEDIEINLYRSFIKEETLQKIKSVIKKYLGGITKFDLSSSAMQLYEVIKDIFVHEDNFMFFNIGGEITEIGIVENDILEAFYTVPIGSHEFSRQLDTFIGEKGDLSTLSFLGDNATDKNLDQIKKDKMNKLKEEWSSEIIKTIKEEGKELPHKVFLVSNSDSIKFFNEIIKECENCSGFEFYTITKELFDKKVETEKNKHSKNNVEYLLSTYYLSIKN